MDQLHWKMYLAIRQKDTDVINEILDNGSMDVNDGFWEDDDDTALGIAAEHGRLDICKLLLQRGANVNKGNKEGQTPLIAAAGEGGVEVCQLLLSNGANINEADNDGETPLMYATESGIFTSCQFLLQNGADINQRDNKGWTALMHAAYRDQVAALNNVLQYQPDIGICSKEGKTAFDLAEEKGNTKIASLLIKFKEERAANSEFDNKRSPELVHEGATPSKKTRSENEK